MASEFSIEIRGLKEVQKALYSYSQQLGDRVVVAALREGAKVVQKEARRQAPKATGRLRSSIVVKKSKLHKGRNGKLGVYLTLRAGKGKQDRRDAFYGRFVEDGWNVRGKATERTGRGRKTATGKRDIPGRKFIKGAFLGKRADAVRVIVASAERGAEIVKQKVGLK